MRIQDMKKIAFGVYSIKNRGIVIGWGKLLGFAIGWSNPRMGRMNWSHWGSVLKSLKSLFNVSGHGNITGVGVVVPVKLDAAIFFAFPVGCESIH